MPTTGLDGLVQCKCGDWINTNFPGLWDREKDVCAGCAEESDE